MEIEKRASRGATFEFVHQRSIPSHTKRLKPVQQPKQSHTLLHAQAIHSILIWLRLSSPQSLHSSFFSAHPPSSQAKISLPATATEEIWLSLRIELVPTSTIPLPNGATSWMDPMDVKLRPNPVDVSTVCLRVKIECTCMSHWLLFSFFNHLTN